MDYWFLLFVLGIVAVVPVHFVSVEHNRLEDRYGKNQGRRIGNVLSLISGWGFFIFWAGIWFSPQPRFTLPLFDSWIIVVPIPYFALPLVHLLVFIPFFAVGAWLGIAGVKETTLKVAETHRAEKVVASGVYSTVRHPQYLGGLLAHFGITFLFSGVFSLLSTPLMILLVFLISRKEETELKKEFGEEYLSYKKSVPMFVPKLSHRKATKHTSSQFPN